MTDDKREVVVDGVKYKDYGVMGWCWFGKEAIALPCTYHEDSILNALLAATERAEKAEAALEHWKGCNLYPSTYRDAVETIATMREVVREAQELFRAKRESFEDGPWPTYLEAWFDRARACLKELDGEKTR